MPMVAAVHATERPWPFNARLTRCRRSPLIVGRFTPRKAAPVGFRITPTQVEFIVHLIPIPALSDNYIWLLHDDAGDAIVVDPGEAVVVEDVLVANDLRLPSS